jgi:glycogen(starch) synthase
MHDVDKNRDAHRALRILFVSREYPPETGGGGIGSYVETMARALAARGHEIHVLSCVPQQAFENTKRDGVYLHRRGVPRWLPKIRRRLPATAFRLEGAFSSYLELRNLGLDIDLVEAPDWMAEGLAISLLGAHPTIVHLHTPLLIVGRENPTSYEWSRDGRLAASVERFAVRRADLATSPSHLLAEDLAREGWLDHLELRVIRYPVDVGPWSSVPSPEAARQRVLAVGRLEARKAPEVLVRAAALLSPELPDLEVTFVGRSSLRNGGSYRDWVVNLAHDLSVNCRFVEEVRRDELPAWYGSSRVVALPSRYDNFPYSGLEAMAAGRPLVCTDTTGTAELIAGSTAGRVVPRNDPEAFARALRPYLLDSASAVRAGLEARSLVERHCSPDRIAEEREACYREAIGRWRGPLRNVRRHRSPARAPSDLAG